MLCKSGEALKPWSISLSARRMHRNIKGVQCLLLRTRRFRFCRSGLSRVAHVFNLMVALHDWEARGHAELIRLVISLMKLKGVARPMVFHLQWLSAMAILPPAKGFHAHKCLRHISTQEFKGRLWQMGRPSVSVRPVISPLQVQSRFASTRRTENRAHASRPRESRMTSLIYMKRLLPLLFALF